VLSSLAVERDLAAGTVVAVPVDGLDLTRTLRVVHRTGQEFSGAARELATIARRWAPKDPEGAEEPTGTADPEGP
jgi:hypothetical protein